MLLESRIAFAGEEFTQGDLAQLRGVVQGLAHHFPDVAPWEQRLAAPPAFSKNKGAQDKVMVTREAWRREFPDSKFLPGLKEHAGFKLGQEVRAVCGASTAVELPCRVHGFFEAQKGDVRLVLWTRHNNRCREYIAELRHVIAS